MFERFTAEARAVVTDAQAQARRLHHPVIGTEHLLLAVLSRGGRAADVLARHGLDVPGVEADVAALAPGADADRDALAQLGIDLDRVRDAADSTFGPGALDRARGRRRRRRLARRSGVAGHIPFSRRAKLVLELSLREALRLGHRRIGAEHIALGLLREGRGLACVVLARRGVPFDELRAGLEDQAARAA